MQVKRKEKILLSKNEYLGSQLTVDLEQRLWRGAAGRDGVEKGLGRTHVAKLHHGKAHGWCVAGAEEGQSKIDIKPFFSPSTPPRSISPGRPCLSGIT
ncbi:hypothetical protein CDAR_398211 [Caerostris darwini]|uniref:Uncharacterized protein n=1 Tax=Caerostris darwini TaxID=1538125 RepID=A0AAV4WS21_9ARAC|nr:hypothetical protein CDAR_398211 [Caerostris darwini]